MRGTCVRSTESKAAGPSVVPGAPVGPAFTRRRFLAGGLGLSLLAVMGGRTDEIDHLVAGLAGTDASAAPATPRADTPTLAFHVERDTDLVQLDMTLSGFTVTRSAGVITGLSPTAGALIIVQFPPQAIGEAAYVYSKGDWLVDPPPVLSVLSGNSRLCFTTDKAISFSSPMAAADLLDWADWTLLLPKVAAKAPAANVTSIEYPYALHLAPVASGGHTPTFTGSSLVNPVTQTTDCWMATMVGSGTAPPAMAAVWADDYVAPTSKPPKTTPAITPNTATIAYGT